MYPSVLKPIRGPTHVIPSKTSLVFVTRQGVLHLLFATYQAVADDLCDDTSVVLEDTSDERNLLTHASIATEAGTS